MQKVWIIFYQLILSYNLDKPKKKSGRPRLSDKSDISDWDFYQGESDIEDEEGESHFCYPSQSLTYYL